MTVAAEFTIVQYPPDVTEYVGRNGGRCESESHDDYDAPKATCFAVLGSIGLYADLCAECAAMLAAEAVVL